MSKITPSHIKQIREIQTDAMKDGSFSVEEASKLKVYTGKGANAADKALVQDILAHDAFDPKSTQKAVLKAAGLSKLERSPVLGVEVGKGVFVSHSHSPVKGHATKLQALAAARMSGSDTAMVVPDKSNPPRWHAVDTAKPMNGAKEMNGAIKLHTNCPPEAYAALYAKAKDATGQERIDAYTKLAAITYGVAEKDVNVMTGVDDKPDPTKVNIDLSKDMEGKAGRITAAGCSCPDHSNFKTGAPYAIEISGSTLADPAKAAQTMFHEMTHADDYMKAQDVMKAYAKAHPKEAAAFNKVDFTKRSTEGLSMADATTASHFQSWLLEGKDKDIKKMKMSLEERSSLQGYMTNETGGAEATAYTQTWMQAFKSAPASVKGEQLAGELLTWADGQQRSEIPQSTAGMKEVFADLSAFYKTLSPEDQTRFKDTIAYVQKRNPKAQIAAYKVPE